MPRMKEQPTVTKAIRDNRDVIRDRAMRSLSVRRQWGNGMKKNEQWTGTCTGYTYDGLGVVRFDDLVFFVPGLLEGEEAELAITAMKKNYGYARIVKLLKKSPHRREPVCGVYRLCGGCQLMHMDDETQQSFKEDKVRNLFLQNAGMEVDVPGILEGEMRLNYRNRSRKESLSFLMIISRRWTLIFSKPYMT